jgi:hypothetical protein
MIQKAVYPSAEILSKQFPLKIFLDIFLEKILKIEKPIPSLGGGGFAVFLWVLFSVEFDYIIGSIFFQLLLSRLSVILFVVIQFVVCSNYKQVVQSQ